MSSMLSPHAVLGVRTGASALEVKAAYRTLAMQTHPDRNDGSGVRVAFKAVTEAYKRLQTTAEQQPWSGCSKAGTAGCSMANGCSSM
jgi:molecular chaperone DnaJ